MEIIGCISIVEKENYILQLRYYIFKENKYYHISPDIFLSLDKWNHKKYPFEKMFKLFSALSICYVPEKEIYKDLKNSIYSKRFVIDSNYIFKGTKMILC